MSYDWFAVCGRIDVKFNRCRCSEVGVDGWGCASRSPSRSTEVAADMKETGWLEFVSLRLPDPGSTDVFYFTLAHVANIGRYGR